MKKKSVSQYLLVFGVILLLFQSFAYSFVKFEDKKFEKLNLINPSETLEEVTVRVTDPTRFLIIFHSKGVMNAEPERLPESILKELNYSSKIRIEARERAGDEFKEFVKFEDKKFEKLNLINPSETLEEVTVRVTDPTRFLIIFHSKGVMNAEPERLPENILKELNYSSKIRIEARERSGDEFKERERLDEKNKIAEDEAKVQEAKPIANQSYEKTKATTSYTSISGSKFTSYSTGYDWNRASTEYKKEYCQLMARTMQDLAPGVGWRIYYDSLNEFYRTSNPQLLKEKITDIIGLTTVVWENGGL